MHLKSIFKQSKINKTPKIPTGFFEPVLSTFSICLLLVDYVIEYQPKPSKEKCRGQRGKKYKTIKNFKCFIHDVNLEIFN